MDSDSFREVRTLNQAKDRRASRRGQITKAKTRLDELLAQHISRIPIATLRSVLSKLKKDINLHEGIQTRFVELLVEGDSNPAAAEVHEEHQEVLRHYKELLKCLVCHHECKKLEREYTLFQDTSSMEVPEYETEILEFRFSFKGILDRLQTITIEQRD